MGHESAGAAAMSGVFAEGLKPAMPTSASWIADPAVVPPTLASSISPYLTTPIRMM